MIVLQSNGCEQIVIGDVTITLIHNKQTGQVSVGIDAPRDTPIRRKDYLAQNGDRNWQPVPTINSHADIVRASMRIFSGGEDA